MNLEAIAVQDYAITSGDGADFLSLQAKIDPKFLSNWNEEMEKLGLNETGLTHNSLSMKRTSLHTGGGNDIVSLNGDIEQSFVNLGKGDDLFLMKGGMKSAMVTMGDGDDIALIVAPPKLTGLLLGGKGLDTLSFKGTHHSLNINLDSQYSSLTSKKRGGWGLKTSSIEAATGGVKDDVLVAGEDTTWLDGDEGHDTYILHQTYPKSSDPPNEGGLTLNLSPNEVLNNQESLVRWDKSSNTYHTQHAFLVTDLSNLPTDYLEEAELLPIIDLADSIQSLGIDGNISNIFNSPNISPWAIIMSPEGNTLINNSPEYGYAQIAELASNSQPEQVTASQAAG